MTLTDVFAVQSQVDVKLWGGGGDRCVFFVCCFFVVVVFVQVIARSDRQIGPAELEIIAGHRTFSDQMAKMTDQVPICLDMNPTGFLLCPSKSYHARTECPTKTQSLFPALHRLFCAL